MKEDTIYLLYTLNDSTGIRYVGITKQSLKKRLSGHISSCKQSFKNKKSRHKRHCWIKSLLDNNQKPTIHLLDCFKTKEEVIQAEIETIFKYKDIYNLVNGTSGGEGVKGHVWTNKQKELSSLKVDQYDLNGNFIKTHNSMSEASLAVTGSKLHNGKISGCTKGLTGRRSFYGYVWRLHGEPFDKYPTKHTLVMTPEKRKNYSNSKLGNKNPMKNKKGLEVKGSRPIIIIDSNNIILHISESIKDSRNFTKFSRSCTYNMLKNKTEVNNIKLIYASEDIVQSLQKCKSSTLKTFVGQKYNAYEVEQ